VVTAPDRRLSVGLLGTGFMGTVHSRAMHLARGLDCGGLVAELHAICGRDAGRLADARRRFGWATAVGDWRALVDDERIGLFDDAASNDLHAEPVLAALRRRKHVLCEKPLAEDPARALAMWDAAERAGVVHMCGFNYRFFPAVALLRQLIRGGALGEIVHLSTEFAVAAEPPSGGSPRWRERAAVAPGGVVSDLGAHHIDLARHLIGEPRWVQAALADEDGVPAAFQALVELDGGIPATLAASRRAGGRAVHSRVVVDGSRATAVFSVRRLNELQLEERAGRRTLLVTEQRHPYPGARHAHGHTIGWADSFADQFAHLLRAIAGNGEVAPLGASFADGYRCAEVCDAIRRAAHSGRREAIVERRGAARTDGPARPGGQ
jgi:predicted dehydrogenase